MVDLTECARAGGLSAYCPKSPKPRPGHHGGSRVQQAATIDIDLLTYLEPFNRT